jgi:YkoY family integral membrane protein
MLDVLDFLPNIGLETPFVLLILIALEAVLSADNAVALASIAQGLPDAKMQRSALNFGLLAAYVLRILLIVTATWVVKYWQFELLGAIYLLWLVVNYFVSNSNEEDGDRKFSYQSLWQVIPVIAFTDLAFSLDSVTTAIAVADEIWLIIAGGTIGVLALRFLSELFIGWIEVYAHLEDAGFVTVGFVGLRLLFKVIAPDLVPPEWVTIVAIVLMFAWGFSKKNPTETEES